MGLEKWLHCLPLSVCTCTQVPCPCSFTARHSYFFCPPMACLLPPSSHQQQWSSYASQPPFHPPLRASPVVLSMWWPNKTIFSDSYWQFCSPPIKLKGGQHICGELLIANHLDQSLWCAHLKHWEEVRSYLLHSVLQVQSIAVPFISQCKLYIMLCQNQFPELNRHILTFLHPIMLCRITYWALLEML